MSKKTKFCQSWLLDDDFKTWVSNVKGNPTAAFCKLCNVEFSLSNMGRQALKSHALGKKHRKNKNAENGSLKLPEIINHTATTLSKMSNSLISEENNNRQEKTLTTCTVNKQVCNLDTFMLRDEVTKAEIMWCINAVMHHSSARSAANTLKILPQMFSDSEIAKKVSCQKDKISYTIVFGLLPYFQNMCFKKIDTVRHISISFDESLNKVAQAQQMDISVRYFDEEKGQVVSQYFNSSFLGHTTSNNLLNGFKSGLLGVPFNKIINISMDGPNVNLKFLRELKTEINGGPVFIEYGTCGLHTVHGAFKTAMSRTGWNIHLFLRSIYNLFKDVPARRADYIHYSGSDKFPKKFCPIRWVENISVGSRALEIIDNLKLFVKGVEKDKKKLDCDSFKNVKSALPDSLLKPKILFFISVAALVEPFLTKFQTDAPVLPYLYDELTEIVSSVLNHIVKDHVDVSTTTKLLKFDFEKKDNFITCQNLNLPISVKTCIKNLKDNQRPSEKEILLFKKECFNCYFNLAKLLVTKSPLKYPFVKGISCLTPYAVKNLKIGVKRLELALEVLIENHWMSGIEAEAVSKEYTKLCSTDYFIDIMKGKTEDRLDDIWFTNTNEYEHLRKFIKMVLIMSHGNAKVERGFSVNKECLVPNMTNDSLVAHRVIYDSIVNLGGLENFKIEKSCIHYARNAHARYTEALKKRKEDQLEEDKSIMERKRLCRRLNELKTEKDQLNKEASSKIKVITEEIEMIQKSLL